MTQAQYDYVIAARARGETFRQIAAAVGLSAGSLSKQMNRGRPLRLRQPQAVDTYIIENIGRQGYRKMAAAMGCNESSVRRRVRALAREGRIQRPAYHAEKVTHSVHPMGEDRQQTMEATYLRLCVSAPGGGFPRWSERPAKNGQPIACGPMIWPVQEAA